MPSRCWRARRRWPPRAATSSISASASRISARPTTSPKPPSRRSATAITATRQRENAGRCRVAVMAVADRLDGGFGNVVGRAEIRLADAEIDDVAALGGQRLRARQHREGIRLAPLAGRGRVVERCETIRVRGDSRQVPRVRKVPLTRLEPYVLATLPAIRAFTPVFDGLWGRGKRSTIDFAADLSAFSRRNQTVPK